MRVWLSPGILELIEDIKRKGLKDIGFHAIVLQKLSTRIKPSITSNTRDVFIVDLTVLEAGISRVLGKYGITKLGTISSNNPIII